MKKLLLCAAVIAASFATVNAQENFKFGIVGGLNVSTIRQGGEAAELANSLYKSKVGYHVGVRTEFGLSKAVNGLYLDASALLSVKGVKAEFLGTVTHNAAYLEIPIHAGYKYAITDNFSVFGSFGPYVGFGLFGKTKASFLDETISYDTFKGEDSIIKRFDWGLGLNAGVEINNKIRVGVGYDLGLANISKPIEGEDADDAPLRNRNFTVSVAYMF